MAFPGGRAPGQGLLGIAHRDCEGRAGMGDVKKPLCSPGFLIAPKTAGAEIPLGTLEAKTSSERPWGPGVSPGG